MDPQGCDQVARTYNRIRAIALSWCGRPPLLQEESLMVTVSETFQVTCVYNRTEEDRRNVKDAILSSYEALGRKETSTKTKLEIR